MIRASVVLLLATLVIPRLRRRSAAERHLLWAMALGAAALCPALELVVPSWPVAWVGNVVSALASPLDAVRSPAEGDLDIVVRATGLGPAAFTVAPIAAAIWMAGSLVAFLLLLREGVKLARLASSAQAASSARWNEIAGEVAESLGLLHRPRLLQSSRVAIPITWGVRRASILLPSAALDWDDARLRIVFAHELAHVRRGDWFVHVAAEIACAVYWFHPLFWIARGLLGRESEQAADDIVVGLGPEGSEVAAHLVAIVRAARIAVRAPSATLAIARPSHLQRRVAGLLDAGANRRGVNRRNVIAVAAVSAAVAMPFAALQARAMRMDVAVRPTTLPLVPDAAESVFVARTVSIRAVTSAGSIPPDIVEYSTPPLYSEQARARRVEGIVTVAARIGVDGRATGARVVKGLGFGLDQNALVALRQWRFQPGSRGGVATAMDADVDVEFSLRNEAMNELIANDMATRVGPGVTPPRAVRVAELSSSSGGEKGTVVLDVVLLENGQPRIVRILQSVSPGLDDSAVRVFEQWRFSPAMKDGRPVSVRITAEVNFRG